MVIAQDHKNLTKEIGISMLPNMSGDRLLAYRVFKGEVDKLKFVKGADLSGIERLVIDYMIGRMRQMEEKGHDDAFGKRYVIPEYKETPREEEDYIDSGGRRKDEEVT